MPAKENTLGAPTEGLGQTVTFAFNPNVGVPQMSSSGLPGVQAGVQGGGVANVQMAQGVQGGPPDATVATLMKFGDKILNRKLEEAKAEAFVTGMQRAMTGEAVADIANEQPWYTKIFGDSDVVEGARAYSSQAAVQNQIAAMEDKMPELRKMDPAQANKFFIESVNQSLTGDKPTDLSIMQAMTRALPSVMRRQAKEHYGYRQEQAAVREGEAFRAGVKRLQGMGSGMASGYVTPEEQALEYQSFRRSLVPAAGRDFDGYKKSLRDLMIEAAHNGNFHALNAMREPEGDVSLMDVLDADQRTAVEKAIEAGEVKLRTKYSFEWNDALAQIKAQAEKPMTDQTTADIASQIDALNSRYNKTTGANTGLITPSERAAMLSGSAVTIAREKDRIADLAHTASEKSRAAGDKAAAEEIKRSMVRQRAAEGSLGTLSANSEYSKEFINESVMPVYRNMTDEAKVKFLVNNMRESYVIDPVRMEREGSVTAALSSGGFTPEVQAVFQQYVQLREANPVAADKYYGQHAAALEGMYQAVQAGHPIDGAFAKNFLQPRGRAKLSTPEMKESVARITQEQNSFLPEWMGGQKLRPDAAREVANFYADQIQEWAQVTGSTSEATSRVLQQAKLNGREFVGGYTWQNQKNQRPLSEYLTLRAGPDKQSPIPTDRINDAFKYAVEEVLYGADGTHGILPDEASEVAIIRMNDGKDGEPKFHIRAIVDAKPYEGFLTGNDIFKLAGKRAKRQADSVGIPASTELLKQAQRRLDKKE